MQDQSAHYVAIVFLSPFSAIKNIYLRYNGYNVQLNLLF